MSFPSFPARKAIAIAFRAFSIRYTILTHILNLIEGLARLLELLVHGQQILDSGVLALIFAHQKDDILNLDTSSASDFHGTVCGLRNVFNN